MDAALSPEDAGELAALRRRAYGPDPDLDDAALSRLQALEAMRHGADPGRAGHAPPPEGGADAAAAEVEEADAVPVPVPVAVPVAEAGPFRTRMRWLDRVRAHPRWWLAGAGALAAVAVAWGIAQVTGPQSDLVLTRIPPGQDGQAFARNSFLNNNNFDIDEIDRFEPYGRLQVWVAAAESGERCLLVDADDYGIVGVSCTPDGLDPIVDVRIWRGMRQDVFGDLPVNTVLRFVYANERVHVWVRSPTEG